MSETTISRTQRAKSLLAGLIDGDHRLTRTTGQWNVSPVRGGGQGCPADAALVTLLAERGLIEITGDAACVSARGRRFATHGAGAEYTAPARPVPKTPARGATQASESPLEWLHRRRGPDGEPLIGRAAYTAGERLRADYTRAGLMPRMGTNLEGGMPGRGRRAGARGPADVLDAALDARERVNRALGAVGPDLSGLLVDVCCYLKSLSETERERGWPKRSAKVVLDLALTRLAAHYGLSEEARGKVRRAGTRHWGAEDYRPGIS